MWSNNLNREVMNMTEEVGKLYREKQVVESQISDLFRNKSDTNQKPALPVCGIFKPLPESTPIKMSSR